jgi:hypothetical protein
MKKIEDKFIPYDLALRLKDLGFDYECLGKYFLQDGVNDFIAIGNVEIEAAENAGDDITFACDAPLWQDAFDWFREQHNLEFQIKRIANGNYHGVIQENTDEFIEILREVGDCCLDEVVDVYSYEEARVEIFKSLIKITKKKCQKINTKN